ncbi:glycosyltransferase family 4 protein [Indiicoccus explosivorum]|uniref:glycosyltransferase family 4 protein n=1 Tax=Indiicoccus explosivorum TaxID=1917864 RepID=UPI00138FE710|nr:glycosyltransferase family 4 protein [Indiicoccus explosivorum]
MKAKIIHAVTVPQSLILMEGQLRYLKGKGYETRVICSPGQLAAQFGEREQTKILPLHMEREISIMRDIQSFVTCVQILKRERPQIVNAGTPKAGLTVMLAAAACRVPIRVYTIRGLRLETTDGMKRKILLNAERLAAGAATHVIAVSESIKEEVIKLGICNRDKISILGKGSSNGFEISRFQSTEELDQKTSDKRQLYGLTNNHQVIGFVGRMTKDKGVEDLVSVFLRLYEKNIRLKLLLVGDYESGDPIADSTRQIIAEHPAIIHAGHQTDPVPFFKLMDIFVLLSKREGFSNVLIEATLSGIPPVAMDVTGTRDTIIQGKTGFLVKDGDLREAENKIEQLLNDKDLRKRLSDEGESWAEEQFRNEAIWEAMDLFYQDVMVEMELSTRKIKRHQAIQESKPRF